MNEGDLVLLVLFAKKESVSLRIQGMHCASCQRKVGDALRAVPGVAAANVDLAFHRASVSFDPSLASIDSLIAAVESSGYHASTA